jgi:hypothetical protein
MNIEPEMIVTGISLLGNLFLAIKAKNVGQALGTALHAVEYVDTIKKGSAKEVKRVIAVDPSLRGGGRVELEKTVRKVQKRK